MISEMQLMEKWRKLTPEKQQQVIHFIELLESPMPTTSGETDVLRTTEQIPAILPMLEIWSPYDSNAAAQDLLRLLATEVPHLLEQSSATSKDFDIGENGGR